MPDTTPLGRSSIDESPVSGDDEVVEPDQGNGRSPGGAGIWRFADDIQFSPTSSRSCGQALT